MSESTPDTDLAAFIAERARHDAGYAIAHALLQSASHGGAPRAVHICATPSGNETIPDTIHALMSDGSIWSRADEFGARWRRAPPIPAEPPKPEDEPDWDERVKRTLSGEFSMQVKDLVRRLGVDETPGSAGLTKLGATLRALGWHIRRDGRGVLECHRPLESLDP